jgi:hypothetical protein
VFYRAGFGDFRRQHCGAPAVNSSGLTAYWVGEKEGDGRGESGLYSGRLFEAVEARERAGEWGLWGVHPREVGGVVGGRSDEWARL